MIESIDVGDAYTIGEAPVTDLAITWRHTSRVVEGHTRVEYRYVSDVTGERGPIAVSPYDAEINIKGLPKANYSLAVQLRYKWFNPLSGSDVNVSNPPGTSRCEEWRWWLKTLDTIGCAFTLEPGDIRVSPWSRSTGVNITALLSPILDASKPITSQGGVRATVAEMLITGGVNPDDAGGLSQTLTTVLWLVLATVSGAALFVLTGMSSGSMYLGTFVWLVIWAGLGPFVAGIPYAMAYMPTALLMLSGGILVLKRGRL